MLLVYINYLLKYLKAEKDMDRAHYKEMISNLDKLIDTNVIQNRSIYLFGHCNSTEELAKLLLKRGFSVRAILDNNSSKHGNIFCGIPIVPPQNILDDPSDHVAVCIVARAYAAMKEQLRKMGYRGEIYKLVDYNSYAEYSLSEDTIRRKQERVDRGIMRKQWLEQKYPGYFKVLCPFSALGDVFFTMSYLPYFLKKRNVSKCVICVIGNACAQVAELFCPDFQPQLSIEIFLQKDIDELIQACLYTRDYNSFIAHQDRPYVVNLHKALYVKCIPLEQIYCCGVFGLPADTEPVKPFAKKLQQYPDLRRINKGKSVIFSPYAKSVTALPKHFWESIVRQYKDKGYQCFTNIAGDEQPLEGTLAISPSITELQSVVEYAGTFVGIRSGLCDVLKYAKCKKTAFYPDYNYCDTRWKAIDMYALEGWENIVIKDDYNGRENNIIDTAENLDF